MTEFDEEKLRQALRDAADGFAITTGATERILDEARDSGDAERPSRIRSLVERTGRARSGLLAAAACIVVLAVAVPLVTAESPSNTNKFSAIPYFKAPSGESIPAPTNLQVQGTSFTTYVGTSAEASGSSKVSLTATKTTKAGDLASFVSSLRVEEVGTIDLTVGANRFESTLAKLTDIATTDGGFVASTRSHVGTKANHSYSTGTIVLQVPEHNFAMLVDEVRHSGMATSVVTSANDVTGQYVNLQARISALKVSRAQYLKIMTRTDSINGILAVQNQLNNIQSQIEQYQAQLNLLNSETTYATLTVALSVTGHQVNPPVQSLTGVDKAWHESLHGFAAGFEWLIRIAGPLLFALLVLAALLLLGRLTWRATERRRSRMS
jgi:uncharacterized protein DUF4349